MQNQLDQQLEAYIAKTEKLSVKKLTKERDRNHWAVIAVALIIMLNGWTLSDPGTSPPTTS
jgi:hypothetical protein